MFIVVEPDSKVPLYLQLRQRIVEGIVRGDLAPGDSLPSVRQLAVDLGINLHTVNKAYGILQAEGFIRIQGRRGAVVSKPPVWDEAFLAELREQVKTLFLEARGRGMDKKLFRDSVNRALKDALGEEE